MSTDEKNVLKAEDFDVYAGQAEGKAQWVSLKEFLDEFGLSPEKYTIEINEKAGSLLVNPHEEFEQHYFPRGLWRRAKR